MSNEYNWEGVFDVPKEEPVEQNVESNISQPSSTSSNEFNWEGVFDVKQEESLGSKIRKGMEGKGPFLENEQSDLYKAEIAPEPLMETLGRATHRGVQGLADEYGLGLLGLAVASDEKRKALESLPRASGWPGVMERLVETGVKESPLLLGGGYLAGKGAVKGYQLASKSPIGRWVGRRVGEAVLNAAVMGPVLYSIFGRK